MQTVVWYAPMVSSVVVEAAPLSFAVPAASQLASLAHVARPATQSTPHTSPSPLAPKHVAATMRAHAFQGSTLHMLLRPGSSHWDTLFQ